MRDLLKSFGVLSDQEIDDAIRLTQKRTLNKSDFFIREGGICKEVAFIHSGIFRSFYISNEGEEITYCITFPNNFLTAYSSFITGLKSPEYIQSLTSAEISFIPKAEIELLAESSKNWLAVLKIIAEQGYIELEKRVFQLQKEKAKQRYIDLIKNYPHYIRSIPLQYLASYLGITQRHLSRLRKEISF